MYIRCVTGVEVSPFIFRLRYPTANWFRILHRYNERVRKFRNAVSVFFLTSRIVRKPGAYMFHAFEKLIELIVFN